MLIERANFPCVALLYLPVSPKHAVQYVAKCKRVAAVELSKTAAAGDIDGAPEHVLGSALAVRRFEFDKGGGGGREVFELECGSERVAVGIVRMTCELVGSIEACRCVVESCAEVQSTPRLIESQVANHVGNVVATRGVAQESVGESSVTRGQKGSSPRSDDKVCCIVNTCRAIGLRVFKRNRAGRTIAKAGCVRDLRDAGHVVGTGENSPRNHRLCKHPPRIQLRSVLPEAS